MAHKRQRSNSRDVRDGAYGGNDAARLCYLQRRKGQEVGGSESVRCRSTGVTNDVKEMG